nr:uncharacterized protein LOC111508214 isoform X1 [Leptinotarsa decemlineata]
MSVQTETNIVVHQNVLLKNTSDNKRPASSNSSSKKRRVTSSMLYLDEEPVFSDSEEERDYMLRIFNKYTSTPKTPRNRETGIQCDISIDNSLFALIKTCSILNPDVPTRFPVFKKYLNELVHVCRKIQSEMPHEIDKHPDEMSDVDNIFVNQHYVKDTCPVASITVDASSPDFLPSSSGNCPQNENLVSRNDISDKLTPSDPIVGEESPPKKIEKKLEKNRKKRRHDFDESLMRRSLREKCKPKKKYKTDCVFLSGEPSRKKNIHKKSSKKSGTKPKENISRDGPSNKLKRTEKSSDKMETCLTKGDDRNWRKHDNMDLSENVSKYLNDSTVHFKIPLPKNLIKPLARNWMKPSKSFIIGESEKPQPQFTSLRQEKVRNLYSPSRWLDSEEFLNSLPRENEK